MSLKGKFTHVELSDTGRVRDHNEDSIGAIQDIGLWVLADGMGGYNAGEVASGIAVKSILDLVREACEREESAATEAPPVTCVKQSYFATRSNAPTK
jgi:serine/threonine protein phosphatase PrpC